MPISLRLPLALTVSMVLAQGVYAADDDSQSSAQSLTGDVDAGAVLYKKDCRGCHGPTAKGLASYPKLRGQTVEYLADKLTRYRKGEKFGPNTPLMAPRAKKLSDEDIINISAFVASLE
ncbi:c-type cytochrome [uncultured Roseobacter sp.]|uniref:c-type cytochrome n=1 Tax=uncultured Roseobacter sp. TaxID=114847 RepID=UPI0026148559|nr:c-type cytochrome [uncultured Roseobacter sp.]